MKPLSPDKRIAFSLVTMTVSVLIFAQIFGLLPDEQKSKLESRKILIESLAMQVTRHAYSNQVREIKTLLDSALKRNPDILSAAVRSANGYILAETGKHRQRWSVKAKGESTSDQIQLPIFAGRRTWGNMEVAFTPIGGDPILGITINKVFLFIGFVGFAGFFLYGYILRKTLHHLDPNAVIPDRVKNAMNIISEGLLIIDENERIILANNSFAQIIDQTPESLTGKLANKMDWRYKSDKHEDLPWTHARKNNKLVSEAPISLTTKQHGRRAFLVNAAPIASDDGKVRGTMVTFNDVTQLHKRNSQLNSAVKTLKQSQLDVQRKNKELAYLASRDPMTGCLNRRSFFEQVEARFNSLINNGEAFSCIMLDIDHFKSVNDNYGHSVGDFVIKSLAKTLLTNMRNEDLTCRYGGEEFCLFMRDADAEDAFAITERIRQQIELMDFSDNPETKDMKITTSFGIADHTDDATSITNMIEMADKALYYSKENGRNRVTKWVDIKDIVDKQDEQSSNSNIEYIHAKNESLTGRPYFIALVKKAIESSNSRQHNLGIFLLNIDAFKRINNTLGHTMGDQILSEIQQRLSLQLDRIKQQLIKNSPDLNIEILNLKGDEFAVIFHDLSQIGIIKQIAQALHNCITKPFVFDKQEINLTSSIGSTLYPQDGESAEVLLRNVEIAVNHAKDRGGNVHQPYLAELNTGADDELEIESKLHSAIRNNELSLHYQPKVDLNTGRITGLEALARWYNPELGHVSPGRFIPIAEQSGLISELGLWVLKTACLQGKKWAQAGFNDLLIAVNLSAPQLKKHDFLDRVFSIFDETGFDPNNLEFEVTENMLMENIETITPIFSQLKEKGISIAIDDFGVGYSSLDYIKRFPVSTIKIDRSFITNINENTDDHAIVSAIIAMAHAMSLKVVAEGAEHSPQLDVLKKLKCDQLQGFIFSKPLPFEDATKLLLANAQCTPGPDSLTEQLQQPRLA